MKTHNPPFWCTHRAALRYLNLPGWWALSFFSLPCWAPALTATAPNPPSSGTVTYLSLLCAPIMVSRFSPPSRLLVLCLWLSLVSTRNSPRDLFPKGPVPGDECPWAICFSERIRLHHRISMLAVPLSGTHWKSRGPPAKNLSWFLGLGPHKFKARSKQPRERKGAARRDQGQKEKRRAAEARRIYVCVLQLPSIAPALPGDLPEVRTISKWPFGLV